MFEIHVGELRATFLRNHNKRRHKDPTRKTTQADNSSPEDPRNPDSRHNRHKHGGAAPDKGHCTRYVAVHPLRGGAPVTWRCTRTEEVHCLRIGCSAPTYKKKRGTGTPNHSPPPPPCATGPYRWQDGHAADAATCTPAHSNTSHTLKCEEPANRSRPIRIGEDSNKSGGDNADDLRAQTPRGRPCGQPLGVSHQHSASSPR